MDPLDPVSISSAARAAQAARGVEASAKPELPFGSQVTAALEEANQSLQAAETSAEKLATGEVDVVETMIALGKADLSLRFVVALRNRALEAYNQIMRLQI